MLLDNFLEYLNVFLTCLGHFREFLTCLDQLLTKFRVVSAHTLTFSQVRFPRQPWQPVGDCASCCGGQHWLLAGIANQFNHVISIRIPFWWLHYSSPITDLQIRSMDLCRSFTSSYHVSIRRETPKTGRKWNPNLTWCWVEACWTCPSFGLSLYT